MIRANLRLRGSPSGRLVGQLAGQPLLKAGHSEVVQCAAVLEQVVSPTNLGTTVASCYQERQLRSPQSFLDAHSWTSGRAEGQLSLQQELAPFERGQHPEPRHYRRRGMLSPGIRRGSCGSSCLFIRRRAMVRYVSKPTPRADEHSVGARSRYRFRGGQGGS